MASWRSTLQQSDDPSSNLAHDLLFFFGLDIVKVMYLFLRSSKVLTFNFLIHGLAHRSLSLLFICIITNELARSRI